MKRKLLSALLSTALAATLLAGCAAAPATSAPAADAAPAAEADAGSEEAAPAAEAPAGEASGKVGVSMPTKDLQRWNQDGANMQSELEAAGFEVDLQFASNDVQTQLSQVENMISSGCSVLVIAAIEGSSLGEALDMAKEAGIPVIAYDRLLMDSDAVSYYATFDNYMVGTVQGTYVKDTLAMTPTASGIPAAR